MYSSYQAKIEDSSCFINFLNYPQQCERYEDGTLPVYKSHSVLTLTTYPQSSRRRKRVRLNDSLSYCSIINDSHQNRQHSSLTQNHSSSSSSFQPSLKKIYVGSSNVDLSTQETIQSQFRSSIYDYQSYIQSFPDYRLRRICSYKYLKHIDHQNNTLNKSQSQQSQKYQHFDYKNLCMLFQDKYFSVQLIDSLNLQEKCLNFVQSYQLSIPSNIQLNSNFSSKQEEEEEENTANQTYLNQNEINFQINSSQLQQFEKENNIIVKQKAKLQINQQLQKNTRSFKRKQEVLTEIENTKTKRPNSRYQILVKNIQYETIKEITDIQKIEFSKRTISKVITKFILFLKGDYRTLKYYDLEQKCQNGTAQRILKNQDPQQFSDEDQNTQAPNFNQNCSFELPKFNLFELLEEQDHKEMLQTDSNSVNKGVNSVRNQRYSLTSNSSQGQCDKFIKEAVRDQYQIHKQNQHHSSFQSTPINQNLDKSQVCINATVKINEDLCPSQDEQQASQSISNSPKANFNKLKQINLQRKQSESSFCPEGYLNPINNNNNDSKIQIKSKQTLFNLSKYLMHLILEYLSEEHLDGLQIIPGFQSLIQNVVKRIKKKGQRTEHSQTYYYNHSHYNCLFLLLSDGNIEYVQNQKELMELHQYVYEINDFIKAFDLTQINFIKAIVARLIIKQFKLIRQLIDQQIQLNPIKYQTYNNYMITKLQYFERVYQGIKNLKKGQILVRF
ncbi:hypothetical protein TTHERM_00418610 (macronuclear) [Tetrahymena thermophila SB210]|uniref:Uncharacterized protein n=1 Tax=Tetrahymena thermophila (strain SB210) TaxID=312017 RepID=Q22NU0_TETTS|nr:hypothetical protein TTHERM_00418610 [Tetrahymena thermophila SB210]EAR87071.2 hypothetical protein TTHERM_00418610 [Tetrahymena thermophila SB210]|eukprot:XP_001007316.2 hypothetical protein TTHERM_00418610 [Tetrahymena thermophila SB210]